MDARKNLLKLVERYSELTGFDFSGKTIPDRFKNFNISCKVAGISDQSYGKVEKRAAATAVYMEYDTIYVQFANYVPPDWD